MPRDKKAPQRLSAADCTTDVLCVKVKEVPDQQPSSVEKPRRSEVPLPEDLQCDLNSLTEYLTDCDVIAELAVPSSISAPLAHRDEQCRNEDSTDKTYIGLLGTVHLSFAAYAEQQNRPCDEFPLPEKAWLYVSQLSDRSMLYFEWPDEPLQYVERKLPRRSNQRKSKAKKTLPKHHFRIIPLKGEVPYEIVESCKTRSQFRLVLRELSMSQGSAEIHVYLSDKAFENAAKTADEISQKNPKLVRVFEYFLNIPSKAVVEPRTLATTKQDIPGLYRRVKDYHAAKDDYARHADFNIQHETLLPQLRPYQVHAVRWMLMKEGFFGEQETTHHSEKELHPLWLKVTLLDGVEVYYQPTMGYLTREKPSLKPMPHGGILADEMGLGKTVEVFALMLMHPRPCEDDYDPKSFEIETEPGEAQNVDDVKVEAELAVQDEEGAPGSSEFLNSSEGGTCAQVAGDDNEVVVSKSEPSNGLGSTESDPEVTASGRSKRKAASRKSHVEFDYEEPVPAKRGRKAKQVGEAPAPKRNQRKSKKITNHAEDGDLGPGVESTAKDDALADGAAPVAKRQRRTATKVASYDDIDVDDWDSDHEAELPKPIKAKRAPRKSVPKKEEAVVADSAVLTHLTRKSKNLETAAYRQMLELSYLEQLKSFSAAHHTAKGLSEKNRGFFDTKVERKVENEFACRCGKDKHAKNMSSTVRCSKCSLVQHAECVGWDPKKQPSPREYICPHCWVDCPPLKSGATLIVTPAAICFQWVDEIKKHIKKSGLKVFVYEGVKKEGYVQPSTLAGHDIVLTTYETLGKEVNYLDLPHPSSEDGRIFRTAKRYLATPSPVTCVEWWRLCLDEAQMVESVLSPVATMARRFNARNRWCVTGTPIERSVSDLYGLFLFLEVDPYSVKRWFEQELLVPFFEGNQQPLVEALGEILWRTCKRDVVAELGLPEQTQITHALSFSAVEEHFYRRTHVACSKQALDYMATLREEVMNTQIGDLHHHIVDKLMAPLLALRQACCHPSAVRAGTYMPLAEKACVTMAELLQQLIKKTKTEAEEALRSIASSLNGMAGIEILSEKFSSAADAYREVIRLASTHEGKVHMDSLQKLHALHNLSEVLFELAPQSDNSIGRAMDDDTLAQRADEVRRYLTDKATQAMLKAEGVVQQHEGAVMETLTDINGRSVQYRNKWITLLMLGASEMTEDNKNKMFTACTNELGVNNLGFLDAKLRKTRCLLTLGHSIEKHISAIFSHRQVVTDQLKVLKTAPMSTLVQEAVECHLRRAANTRNEKKLCSLCQLHDLVEGYETSLFDMKSNARGHEEVEADEKKGKTVVYGELRRGTWKPSKVDTVLKCICRHLRNSRVDEEALAIGNLHQKAMDGMRKEFKPLRDYWRGIFDVVSVTDELAMCITRMELGLGDDYQKNIRRPANVVFYYELGEKRAEFVAQKQEGDTELEKKLGQLAYLNRLQGAGFGSDAKNSSNDEDCPVCKCALGRQWAVLTCAHCYCLDCIRLMIQKYAVGTQRKFVKCAVCRQDSHHGEISYIIPTPQTADADSQGSQSNEEEPIKVVGNVSTKIEGLIVALKRLLKKEPEAKSIVFSSWGNVLDIVANALEDNGIAFKAFLGKAKGTSALTQFKHEQRREGNSRRRREHTRQLLLSPSQPDNLRSLLHQSDPKYSVLLMPIHLGSKGLNLTEATHVFFVEQILNPGVELQAIGRVDRIGQTKPTFVHRFVISRTVEENLSAMLQAHRPRHSSFDGNEPGLDNDTSHMPANILLKELKDLFVDRTDT